MFSDFYKINMNTIEANMVQKTYIYIDINSRSAVTPMTRQQLYFSRKQEFAKCLGILEISQISRHFRNFLKLRNRLSPDSLRNLGFPKFPGIWGILEMVYFSKCLSMCEIPQIPRYLGSFPDSQEFGEFSKWYIFKILEISQMTGYLGNSPNVWVFGKFP